MQGKTHAACGALVSLGAARLIQENALLPDIVPSVEYFAFAIGLGTIGGLFPDIDIQTSKIGQHIKLLSAIIRELFGHRRLFHWWFLYIALFGIAAWQFPAYFQYALFLFLGILSHLLLDLFNRVGIPFINPYDKRVHIANIKSGGKIDNLIASAASIAFLFLSYPVAVSLFEQAPL